MNSLVDNCWFLTGATAVGKTDVGIEMARQLDAEIVSMDSMAIYRGMDIGTAKPTAEERTAVAHHLVDIVDPDEEFSVAQYLEAVHHAVSQLQTRGKAALFVGGTPLYLKSLLRGLFEGPPANWELREEIEAEVARVGQEALYTRLQQVDPVAAAQIHPHDTRRLVRALEVYRATGEPISHQQVEFEEGRSAQECRVFVLRRSREEQHARIERRVDRMIEQGLIDEVRRLTAKGQSLSRTAAQAVGYREVLDYLAGRQNLHETVERIKARTRRFAKRQGTWFRSLSECRFIDVTGEIDAAQLASQLIAVGSGK
jgi:tRNA dimethylallyltransferase